MRGRPWQRQEHAGGRDPRGRSCTEDGVHAGAMGRTTCRWPALRRPPRSGPASSPTCPASNPPQFRPPEPHICHAGEPEARRGRDHHTGGHQRRGREVLPGLQDDQALSAHDQAAGL